MENAEDPLFAGIAATAVIANPARPVVRLRGSRPSHDVLKAIRQRRDDDDGPLPDDDPPPPPPPPISTPDLALQIAFCLPPGNNASIVAAIRQAIGGNVDVRTVCVGGSQRLGVWLRPSVSEADNQARNRGLERLNVLGGGEIQTFFVNSGLIRRQALAGWNAAPKRLDHDGDADPGGPVHLTGFSLVFESPDRIVTHVDGFDEDPWPDVDFRLSTFDTLSLSGDRVSCASEVDLDVDTSWLNFLTGLFLLTLPPLGVVFLVQRIIIATIDSPEVGAGAGCGAASLIPQEILISGGEKVVFSYSRVEVSTGGIFAGGSFVLVARDPEVSIAGPNQLSVAENATSISRGYTVRTDDMRPPLTIVWSGNGTAQQQGAETTSVRFNIADGQPGEVLPRRVAVRVTDADNLVASAEIMVRIFVTPEDDDGLPPVCKLKPWLPQCQDSFALLAKPRAGAPVGAAVGAATKRRRSTVT